MPDDIREKLLNEFILPFRTQVKEGCEKGQVKRKDLGCRICGVSPTDITRVFNSIDSTAPEAVAPGVYLKVYKCLNRHWTVLPGNCFIRKTDDKHDEELSQLPPAKIDTYRTYPKSRIIKCLKDCRSDIKIIDTFSSFLYDFREQEEKEAILEWLAKSQKKLKMLVLDPGGLGLELRLKSNFNIPSTTFRSNILSGLKSLLELVNFYPSRFEVRVMDELPAMHGILMGDSAFFGLHYSFTPSQNASFFEVHGSTNFVFSDFNRHFDEIWEKRSQRLDTDLLATLDKKVKQANLTFDLLQGVWKLFFHDRWPRPGQKKDFLLGNISCARLKIERPQANQYMVSEITYYDAQLKKNQSLYSNVRFENLHDCDFARLWFTDYDQISIQITLRCMIRRDTPLMGHLTLMNNFDLYTSPVLLYRAESVIESSDDNHQLSEEKTANDINFRQPQYAIPIEKVSPELVRSIAFTKNTSFSLETFREQFLNYQLNNDLDNFSGVYRMYAYGRSRDKGGRGIQINIIEIMPSGFVKYKTSGFEAHGIASVKENNLYITLQHKDFKHRTGYFIFHTINTPARKNDIYAGVFLGISYRMEVPMARRVILSNTDEGFDYIHPDFALLNSPEYKALPKELRKNLTGRIENNIGFLNRMGDVFDLESLGLEWEHSVHFDDILFESACFRAMVINRDTVHNTLEILERAVHQGFSNLKEFEKNIFQSELRDDIIKSVRYQRIKQLVEGSQSDTE